jgi:hypothetical protein
MKTHFSPTPTDSHAPMLIGLRFQDENLPTSVQFTEIPWDEFATVFTDYYWGHSRPETGDEDYDWDQEREDEFSGDGAWFQLATGTDLDADPTMAHALLVEVAGLPRETLQARLKGISALGYTMYTHCPDDPVWRMIIPFSKPVSINTADAVHKKFFAEMMNGGCIYNQDDQGRCIPRPGCRNDLQDFFDHFKIDGHFIEVEAVLSGQQNWDGSPTFSGGTMPTFASPTPAVPPSLAHIPAMDVRFELEAIFSSLTTPEDFPGVYTRVMELEFELNRRKTWAPAFRPLYPIPHRRADLKPAHRLIQQARVVVDCHWLHTHCQKRQAVKEARWQPLLDPSMPFPLALAQDFAARAIEGAVRADEILCLTPFQQVQTRSMSGKKLANARRKAEDATPAGRSPLAQTLGAINQWAASDSRLHADKYEALARAIFVLEGSKHTNMDLGDLVGFSLGETPIQENQVRAMRKRLDAAVKRYT